MRFYTLVPLQERVNIGHLHRHGLLLREIARRLDQSSALLEKFGGLSFRWATTMPVGQLFSKQSGSGRLSPPSNPDEYQA